MKTLKFIFGILFGIIASFAFVQAISAQAIPTLDFFHGRECPHCHKEKAWFPELKEAYPDIKINEYEVWHDAENAALAEARMKELGLEFSGVPTNIIGDEAIVGFNPDGILELLEKNYGAPAVVVDSSDEDSGSWISTFLEKILSWFGV